MKTSAIAFAALVAMVNADLTGDLTGEVNGILSGVEKTGGDLLSKLGEKLGLDLSIPDGLNLPLGSEPTEGPGEGCSNVYHPPHSGVDIDGCNDYSNNGWHYVHPGTPTYGNHGSYTWGTSTQYATQVSTVLACPTTVTNCPASSHYVTTITVPTTTTICPLAAASSTYAPAAPTYVAPVSTPAPYVAPVQSSAPYVAPVQSSAPYVAPAPAPSSYVAPVASAPYVAPAAPAPVASAPYVAPPAAYTPPAASYVAPASPYTSLYVNTPTVGYAQPAPTNPGYLSNGTIPYGSGATKVGFSFAAGAGLVAALFM